MLSDTHPEAERVQAELLRKATVAQRLALMRSLTSMATKLSRRGIAAAHPDFTAAEVELVWLERHYGKRLAEQVGRYLREHSACSPTTP